MNLSNYILITPPFLAWDLSKRKLRTCIYKTHDSSSTSCRTGLSERNSSHGKPITHILADWLLNRFVRNVAHFPSESDGSFYLEDLIFSIHSLPSLDESYCSEPHTKAKPECYKDPPVFIFRYGMFIQLSLALSFFPGYESLEFSNTVDLQTPLNFHL